MPERDWLYELLDKWRKEHSEELAAFRLEVRKDSDDIKAMLREQNGRVKKSEDRILTIEVERAQEDKHAMKRGGTAGVLTGGGIVAVIEMVKAYLGK